MSAVRSNRSPAEADVRYDQEPAAAPAWNAGSLSTRGMGWAGIMLIGFGWTVQMAATLPGTAVSLLGANLAQFASANVAQSLMLTGFGVAILAALRRGFGALSYFFEAVLQRSAKAPRAAGQATSGSRETPAERTDTRTIVSRGKVRGRSYVAFADGTVEVETLLGARRFNSLHEARSFIGP